MKEYRFDKFKFICVYLLILAFTINFVNAQEEDKETKESNFEIIARAGIGYGIMGNDVEPNYNLNVGTGEILINYKFWKEYSIATGIAYNELSGNGFNSEGNFFHERSMLKIPLLLGINTKLGKEFRTYFTFGVYARYITKDKYHFLSKNIDNVYDGWNFGAQVGLSFIYQLYDTLGLGVNFNFQSDFSQLKSNSQIVNDEQKIKNLNTVGLMVIFGL